MPSIRLALAALALTACAPTAPKDDPTPSGADTASPAADTADTGATPPRTLASGSHTLSHDGLERAFRLHVPDDLPVGAPLVVALHGYGSSAENIQGYAGFDALAEDEGFAVLYPDSTLDRWGWRCWNVGYCDNDDVDDTGFLRAAIGLVRDDHGLDRVLVTGMSNGGDMTYRMACEASDLVAVAAPVTGCLMTWLSEACAPPTPPPLLHIHGNADTTTLWAGDPDYTGGGYRSTLDSVGHFADLHDATAYSTAPLPEDADSTVHTWSPDGDPRVQLIELDGVGHVWPSGGRHILTATPTIWASFTAQVE